MPVAPGGMQGPSTFDKFKMGALMGGTVGAIMGFIMGTVTIFNYGAGPNGVMRTLGKYVAGSGATFGYSIPHLALLNAMRLVSLLKNLTQVD
ncbi:mitochondrial genome maintenance protein Mgr2 [Ascosphaera apis ARSEF 7405]|uniref:Mitochondrial genome maintenance protein Mgr2 n=1 Tax=Ascosphaera apis ARSEF 7405 TaxID=392613 RepID=A0A162IC45_9EURO|nr:mitochondrial genome maintenance protein Mgr2 [Ascosphaera apis ARSEF 7405]